MFEGVSRRCFISEVGLRMFDAFSLVTAHDLNSELAVKRTLLQGLFSGVFGRPREVFCYRAIVRFLRRREPREPRGV